MRKLSITTWILGILGLSITVGVCFAVWLGLSLFVRQLISIDPGISAAIIGAMTTVFAGIGAVLISQRQTKLREIDEAHREKKVAIYRDFVETVSSVIGGPNKNISIEAPSDQQLVDFAFKFKTEIILWGSPKVIKAQRNFETISNAGGDRIGAFDELLRAIREDIGLSNKGLNNFELIKLYLSDPEEYDRIRASS